MIRKRFRKLNELLKKIRVIENSDLFDDVWYKETYHLEKCEDLAGHYLLAGYKLGYNPSPRFSTEGYLICNEDVKESDINPLYHYEKYGKEEGRIIQCPRDEEADVQVECPQDEEADVQADCPQDEEADVQADCPQDECEHGDEISEDEYMSSGAKLIKYSEFFDEQWYRSQYNIPDETNAAEHYFVEGYKLGYNPSLFFSTDGYLKYNKDIKISGVNPLEHYEVCGKYEFRIINYVE